MSRTAAIKIAAAEHRFLMLVWPHLPVFLIGAIYEYHRAHRRLIAR